MGTGFGFIFWGRAIAFLHSYLAHKIPDLSQDSPHASDATARSQDWVRSWQVPPQNSVSQIFRCGFVTDALIPLTKPVVGSKGHKCLSHNWAKNSSSSSLSSENP